MNKIEEALGRTKAFIPFIICGDPDLAVTAAAVRAAAANGADLIELGVPFSDPAAEGALMQRSNQRALHGGVNPDRIFRLVAELRSDVSLPLVLMVYANLVLSYGAERFIAACKNSGVDGLLVPDLPFEEKDEFQPLCRRYGVALVSVVAPARRERIAMIAGEAEGFVYVAAASEAAGASAASAAKSEIQADTASIVRTVRENTGLPCVVGPGISTPEQAKKAAEISDGAVAGAALIGLLERYGREAPEHIGAYVRKMKAAVSAN